MASVSHHAIPTVHRPKQHGLFKTWFDQPGRKLRRRVARQNKAQKAFPKPVDALRPAVQCETIKYNMKSREGRGFTLDEIKAAGFTKYTAKQFGIAVDFRRKNKSDESFNRNVERLSAYKNRIVVLNKNETVEAPVTKNVMPVQTYAARTFETAAITEEDKKYNAFHTIRMTRAVQYGVKKVGKRAARSEKK